MYHSYIWNIMVNCVAKTSYFWPVGYPSLPFTNKTPLIDFIEPSLSNPQAM